MNTRRIIVIACLLALAALAAALSYVAAASAREPDLPPRRAMVTPLDGDVSIWRASWEGTSWDEWVLISTPTEIFAGDRVQTSEDSMAEIDLFGQGVMRLEAVTTVTFEQLGWDETREAFSGSVLLEAGRLWSRLLDFLAPESSYDVHTSTLSATVRGTAFAVQVAEGRESILVDEHAVHIAALAGDWEGDVAEGMRMDLAPAGRRSSAPKVAAFDLAKETWVLEHRVHDARYAEEAVRARDAAVEWYSNQGAMMQMADRVRLGLPSGREFRQRAVTRSLSRAAAAVLGRLEDGNSAEAVRHAAAVCARARNRGAACRLTPRMDEALVRRGLELPEENLRGWDEAFPEAMERLRRIRARRASFTAGSSSAASEPIGTGDPAPSEPPTEPAILPRPLRLEMAAARYAFMFNESSELHAYLRWSDGRTEDVTERAMWILSAPIGQLRANVFTAGTKPGQATLTASLMEGGESFAVSEDVRVEAPPAIGPSID